MLNFNLPFSPCKQPHLYTLIVLLKDSLDQIVDCESCLVGIRSITKAPKQLLVNGCPVVIRGVNRHEHHPRLGKTNIESCMVQVMLPFCFSLGQKLNFSNPITKILKFKSNQKIKWIIQHSNLATKMQNMFFMTSLFLGLIDLSSLRSRPLLTALSSSLLQDSLFKIFV